MVSGDPTGEDQAEEQVTPPGEGGGWAGRIVGALDWFGDEAVALALRNPRAVAAGAVPAGAIVMSTGVAAAQFCSSSAGELAAFASNSAIGATVTVIFVGLLGAALFSSGGLASIANALSGGVVKAVIIIVVGLWLVSAALGFAPGISMSAGCGAAGGAS